MILSYIWDNKRKKKSLGHPINESEYEKSCCLLWRGDIREIWTLWCPSELLPGAKRHRSKSGCSQGLLGGLLAVKHCPRVQPESCKRRGKPLKVFSIYTARERGAQTAACFGVPAARICVSWASQADARRHHRTDEISTSKVSQERREPPFILSKPNPSPWLANVRNALL